MSEPIVLISRNRIKPGKADDFRHHYEVSVPRTLADKPGTLAQLAYMDEESAEVVIVRVLVNADALDLQLQGAEERSKKTYELIEPVGIEILGTPNPSTMEKMGRIAGSGIGVRITPEYALGFVRQLGSRA